MDKRIDKTNLGKVAAREKELAICSITAVKCVERVARASVTRLFMREDRVKMFGGLCKALAAAHKFYKVATDEELEKLCATVHHEGVVAFISAPRARKLDEGTIDSILKEKDAFIILDHIGNDANFGSIVRSAAFFGVTTVITSDNLNPFTTQSFRTSEGCLAFTDVFTVHDIPKLLNYIGGRALTIATVTKSKIALSAIKNSPKKPLAIIFGNEEEGVSNAVRDLAKVCATIPKGLAAVDSLNVSQACAVTLYELVGRFLPQAIQNAPKE